MEKKEVLNIWEINLTTQSGELKIYPINSDFSQLLFHNFIIEEFLNEDTVVFLPGELSGFFKGISSCSAYFHSPHTGSPFKCVFSGKLGSILRLDGIDAVIIKGALERPSLAKFNRNSIDFLEFDIEKFKTVSDITNLTLKNFHVFEEYSTFATSSYAKSGCSYCDLYFDDNSIAHRGGLGSVFASKNLFGGAFVKFNEDRFNENNFANVIEKRITDDNSIFPPSYDKYQGLSELWLLNSAQCLLFRNGRKTSSRDINKFLSDKFAKKYALEQSYVENNPVANAIKIQLNSTTLYIDTEIVLSLLPLLEGIEIDEIVTFFARVRDTAMDPITLGRNISYLLERQGKDSVDLATLTSIFNSIRDGKGVWAQKLGGSLKSAVSSLHYEDSALYTTHLELEPYLSGMACLLSQFLLLSDSACDGRYIDLANLDGYEDDGFIELFLERATMTQLLDVIGVDRNMRSFYSHYATLVECFQSMGTQTSLEDLLIDGRKLLKKDILLFNSTLNHQEFSTKIFDIQTPIGRLSQKRFLRLLERVYTKLDF